MTVLKILCNSPFTFKIKQNTVVTILFLHLLHLNLVDLVSSWNLNHNIKEFGSRGQTEKLDFIHFLESECLWRWILSFSNNVNFANFSPLAAGAGAWGQLQAREFIIRDYLEKLNFDLMSFVSSLRTMEFIQNWNIKNFI